jgi:sterol desaturase/sphingolipid hydroxylase (fatty acid hydroxylase superfamily)
MSPTLLTLAIIGGTAAALFVHERRFPLRPRTTAVLDRLRVNVVVSAVGFAAAALVVRPLISLAIARSAGSPAGDAVPVSGALTGAKLALQFLGMDLLFYYWHRLNHRVPFLWRFHDVHHIDPDLDVTTAFRFHFGEIALSGAFRTVQVLVVAPPAPLYAVYEIVFQTATLFHHSNLRLPIAFERALNRVVVTPRMHGIHHSQVRRETDSNYGVVFTWWDRLHRTITLHVPQALVTIGVPGYSRPDDNTIAKAFAMPFTEQHATWATPDGKPVERNSAMLAPDASRLAE